ncbi:FIST signal transduction protein [cyanobacterium endosymbiont of Epithemia clementina EcSB]|uniref:FIST signal transduction protein n=1 Tax=cyanobacterium endosymbiont of Epithemia clementina EcSB TaxID=3034674 RepID=UPI002480B7CD|nr:FIST N-terminal domain-containing protein [cyanobacterium endosymbiont of Epithemia clementina EcSB]WGT67578.1 FIST C-terminal domain-containing protein [cyanobacterium endosymbiont of Epithemia clementina EcSB]
MVNQMQWVNALSIRPSLEAAVTEVIDGVKKSLSQSPDLGILFISSAYASDYPRLIPLILEKLSLPILIGCSGGGVIGIENSTQIIEVESGPALSLTVASLPEIDVQAFYVTPENLPDLDSSPDTWSKLVGVPPEQHPHFILLSDPFFPGINDLLAGLDFAYPDSVKIGGLASTGIMNVQSSLFYYTSERSDIRLCHQGTVGLALNGKIIVESIVAQGCRPIGKPYQITQGEHNVILQLGKLENTAQPIVNRSPLESLRELIKTLNKNDRQLAEHSLFIGVVSDEFKHNLQPGDFLIRNLVGVDPQVGAIAIGNRVRPGQRVQFHLRDAKTSADDLELLLRTYTTAGELDKKVQGALMFSCSGRGKALYNQPNFDSELFRRYLPQLSLGGFFCNGEIGPVGGQTFLHGYTSVFALFCQPN